MAKNNNNKKAAPPALIELSMTPLYELPKTKAVLKPLIELSMTPLYELPKTKAVLKPLIDAGENVANALSDNHIDIGEWVGIALKGIPLIDAMRNLQAFIAETAILNKHPEAKEQLFAWFQDELNLPLERHQIELVIEATLQYAMQTWNYIYFMKTNFADPKKAAIAARKGKK